MPLELKCMVQEVKELTPTVFQIRFSAEPRLEFAAGQYVSIVVPGLGPGGRDLRRPYSIASGPLSADLEICVKLVANGPGTNWLRARGAGDEFKSFAPYGSFGIKSAPGRPIFFLATGTGISPFRSMLQAGVSAGRDVTVLLGVSGEDEILYQDELSKITGVRFVPCISRAGAGFSGFRGRLTDYLRKEVAVQDLLASDFYACGNGAMIDESKALLLERGMTADHFFREIYYKPKAVVSGAGAPNAQEA